MSGPNLDRYNMARWTTLLLVFGLIAALMVSFNAQPAYAADVIYVDAGVAEPGAAEPDGLCSLREAVDVASNNVGNSDCMVEYGTGLTNNNVIYVPPGTYNLDSTTGPLLLKKNMRLRGPFVNVAAADLVTGTTRPISPATEAIIQYSSGTITNMPLIAIQSARVEVEGLTLRTQGTTNNNAYGVNIQSNYADIEIRNNIFTDLTYGIAVRSVAIANNTTDIAGNAFVGLDEPGSFSGIGVYFAGINGSNVEIEANLFRDLNNYAIRVPSIGSAFMMVNLNIQENTFFNVASAVSLTRTDTVSITNNIATSVTGSAAFNAVFDVFDSAGVQINNNTVIDSTLPALRVRGTANEEIYVFYNRFVNTDTAETVSPGSNYAIAFNPSAVTGYVTVDNNWWGSNDGPGIGTNDDIYDLNGVLGGPIAWVAYRAISTPNPIGLSAVGKSDVYVDFFSTYDGVTIDDDLNNEEAIPDFTQVAVALDGIPIGTIDKSVVSIDNGASDIVTFTSDGVNPGTQDIVFSLDDEEVTEVITVNAAAQVVCDYNDGLFNDPVVEVTEGETIGDRCILKLTSDPGPGNFVDVTISSSNPALLGFYNAQSGNLQFSNPPNANFQVRFGTDRLSGANPPVVKWDTGVVINFSALPNTADRAGSQYYPDLVTCEVANTVGTPGYSVGDCPGLSVIPVNIYDPGVRLLINNSDLDLTGNMTDVCTFPSFTRDYEVVLSGPPGLNADPSNPPIQPEIVTVNVQSAFPNRVDVTFGATSVFDRTNWNVPQPVTIARIYTPPNMGQPDTAIWNYTTSSFSDTSVTASPYYDDGVDNNGDSLVDGVSTTLIVTNPSCPLLDGDGGVTSQELPAAPFAAAPETPSGAEGTLGE